MKWVGKPPGAKVKCFIPKQIVLPRSFSVMKSNFGKSTPHISHPFKFFDF